MTPEKRRSSPLLLRRVAIVALHDLVGAALAFAAAVGIRHDTDGAPRRATAD